MRTNIILALTAIVSFAVVFLANERLRVYYEDCVEEQCVVLPLPHTDIETHVAAEHIDLVVATVIGEVRGVDRPEEVAAVTDVIFNRWRDGSWGRTLSDVVLYSVKGRHAFSCWNRDDPSFKVVTTQGVARDPNYKRIRWIVELHLQYRFQGKPVRLTDGATHYYHPASMKPVGRVPVWAERYKFIRQIGGARFYRAPWAHRS